MSPRYDLQKWYSITVEFRSRSASCSMHSTAVHCQLGFVLYMQFGAIALVSITHGDGPRLARAQCKGDKWHSKQITELMIVSDIKQHLPPPCKFNLQTSTARMIIVSSCCACQSRGPAHLMWCWLYKTTVQSKIMVHETAVTMRSHHSARWYEGPPLSKPPNTTTPLRDISTKVHQVPSICDRRQFSAGSFQGKRSLVYEDPPLSSLTQVTEDIEIVP